MRPSFPFGKLTSIAPGAFTISSGFWGQRIAALREVTLPSQFRAMESTGRIDNFRRAAGLLDGPHQGFVFNDSDVYKWLEAAGRAGPDTPCAAHLTEVIQLVRAAQHPDGYLNTAFMFDKAEERWSNIRDKHELYCAGHLIEAALALDQSGDDRLIEVARRFADLICRLFGPEEAGKIPVVPGHQEIEIALIALYRATGEQKYLDQAKYFLEARGQNLIGGQPYHQDHVPFHELEKMTGHAVRALYLNIAAADLYLETGMPSLLETLERLWERLYTRQIYVTGGLGARHTGEAFGDDYELPNEKAYSETCASVAAIFWNNRMLQISGDARYADAIENVLFNAALAGISLTGDHYFYTNPLSDEGSHRRAQYFNCACCPPNIARLLAVLPEIFISTGEGAVWIHQYAAGRAKFYLGDKEIVLQIDTDYPLSGDVRIVVETPGAFKLKLRIPGWAETAELRVNGEVVFKPGSGYADVERDWREGDRVELRMPFLPRFLEAHPSVKENEGRVAVALGPLVYCVESADPHPEDLRIATDVEPVLVPEEGWHNLKLSADFVAKDPEWDHALYRLKMANIEQAEHPVEVTAVPYFTWANTNPKPMRVWLREK